MVIAIQLALLVSACVPASVRGDEDGEPASADLPVPAIFEQPSPNGPADLRAMQDHIQRLVVKLTPAVVMVQTSRTNGTGVIVSRDGLILTAAHVVGEPGDSATIALADGKAVKARTLGVDRRADVALVKIIERGEWRWADLGQSGNLQPGRWCLHLGYPGPFNPGREPEVRLGRMLSLGPYLIRTDCVAEGGDSGSPLFDMSGLVLGTNHRYGLPRQDENFFIPVDRCRRSWDRMLKGESWGKPLIGEQAYLDYMPPIGSPCTIQKIREGSSAERVGFKAGDIIIRCEGQVVKAEADLNTPLMGKIPGDEVTFEIRRAGKTITVRMILDPPQE